MKYVFYLILLTFSFSAVAQPTITGAVIPALGASSTFRLFNAQNTTPGDSGANITWDYSGLTVTGSAIFDYKDPSTMPAGSNFAKANLGIDQNGDPQIYLIADNQQYTEVGIQFNGINEDYNTNPKELVRFPITFGTQFVDSFEGTAVAGTINVNRKGSIVIEGDGYGDLILPYVTFQNVLRIRTISVYKDKLLNNVVNSGTDTVYVWYKEGVKDYIFNRSHISSSVAGDIYYGAFLDTMFVGIEKNERNSKTLFISPNPARDVVTIEFKSQSKEQLSLDILDVSGKIVKQVKLKSISGMVREEIDITDLISGVYTVVLNHTSGILTKRLVIK